LFVPSFILHTKIKPHSIEDKNALLPFNSPKIPALNRIGPHNLDIISVIVGNILGDGWGENRAGNTRFHIHMGSPNVEYLMLLHKFYSERGYCSAQKPKLKPNIGKENKVYFSYKFRTWTYSSWNWLYDGFYQNKIKIIPSNIDQLLTPLALAIWIMDDGAKVSKALKLSINSFSYEDCLLLVKALYKNFNIKASIQSAGQKDQYLIYI